ncbi:hypothetical protein ESA_00508 [Cronobacter sakazakii ATCC BAA-894]|uniref:Uncharacterized protein n=1 Tax=Cronobacter sakazakii (strain ATCC BAA-894) TaxID=290339 RepID=A7MR06_CROS8|nr:hypothetical protein ESA_00508 [Cronobacter sakazakii ATCC BAA-894]
MAAVFAHRRDSCNGVHRHQEQDHRDNRTAQRFDHAENARVQGRYDPSGDQHEQRGDAVQFVYFDGFATAAQRFNHHAVEAFTCAQIVAEERFGDGDDCDNRTYPGDNRHIEVVSQVRQDGDVLCFRFRQVFRGEAQYAAEYEEHHGNDHHDVRVRQNAGAFFLRFSAVLFTFRHGESGDDRRVVKGEHHDRDSQPQGHQQAITGGSMAERESFQRCTTPVRDQEAGHQHQDSNEREHQYAHRFHDHLLAETHDSHHADNQNQRKDRARRRRQPQLVCNEAINRVSDRYAVHQQDRVNCEEIEKSDDFTCTNAEMFFDHFGDVFTWVFTGQHEAGQRAVCEEGHRECKNCHDNQGNQATNTGVDRQEKHPCANRGAVQAKHPHGISFSPRAAFGCCSNIDGLSRFHLCISWRKQKRTLK